jgi:hypothetical protein
MIFFSISTHLISMETLILLYVVGGIVIILACFVSIFWFGGLLLPMFYGGGPFVPTSNKTVDHMIRLAQITASDRVADLGSGDGRMLIAAMKAGAKSAVGYEIHPGLVAVSRSWARKEKLQDKVETIQKSFWKADVHDVNVVLLYQLPDSMEELENKLREELPDGARVVSHAFPMKTWVPTKIEGKLYLYEKK